VRILLTGGSGFVGRHVKERLGLHHEVLAPTHVELELANAAAVSTWLGDHPVDAVVHAAVKPGHRNAPDQANLVGDNLRQFFSLVRCRAAFGRLVVLTSGAVYGIQRPLVRVTEDQLGEEVPTDDHGFSKYVEALWLQGDPDAVELRPFGVYGPGEDYAIRFISNACCKALLGMPVTLRRDRLFSYVWVEDLAALVGRALGASDDGLAPGSYNVTPGDPISLRALADLVISTSGTDVPVMVGDSTLGAEYSGDGSKLASVDPSCRFTTPAQGVQQLLDWYATRRDSIDRAVLETDR
jgi:UDP-glucose 4-epimerase